MAPNLVSTVLGEKIIGVSFPLATTQEIATMQILMRRIHWSLTKGLGNVIIVNNLPVVAKEKFQKLEGVVRKIYSQIGVIKENGVWMPVQEDTGKTRGYYFIQYNTPQFLGQATLPEWWLQPWMVLPLSAIFADLNYFTMPYGLQ